MFPTPISFKFLEVIFFPENLCLIDIYYIFFEGGFASRYSSSEFYSKFTQVGSKVEGVSPCGCRDFKALHPDGHYVTQFFVFTCFGCVCTLFVIFQHVVAHQQ